MNVFMFMARPARGLVVVLVVLAALALTLPLPGCGGTASGGKYHCPMHPTYISDRPGDCPICGMRLVPIEKDGTGASMGADHAARAEPGPRHAVKGPGAYACPMHPDLRSDDPAARCPVCHMKLKPIDEIEGAAPNPPGWTPAGAHAGHASSDPAATAPPGSGAVFPPGYAPLELHREGIQLAGVQTATAARDTIGRAIRAVGTVKPDERRIRHVHTKIEGWVEHLYANFTGQLIQRGQPVLSIYSQELLASQEEFLRAREAAERFSASELPEVREGAEDLLRAARRRLELLDVPEAQIAELERTGQPQRAVTLLSPASGYVTSKATFEGQQVEPGMELFTVTDLSSIWVEADVYEMEASAIRVGMPARVTAPYDADQTLSGRLTYVYPYLDPDTRTLRVRLELPNPGLALKPDMYVNVELNLEARPSLTIPDSAVIDTGIRQVVFVDLGGGRFVPREVTLGTRAGGKAEVLSGVREGERVVVRANFLLDSESRLRAAIAGMGSAGGHQH